MITLDIIILAVLVVALFWGLRDGLILQGISILGLVCGLWLASAFGDTAAEMLSISGDYSSVWGYAIVLVVSIIAVSILGRILRKVLHFAGLGIFDALLGGVLSVVKFLLILSLLFTAFNFANGAFKIVNKEHLERSRLFYPIANITTYISPALEWSERQLDLELLNKEVESKLEEVI